MWATKQDIIDRYGEEFVIKLAVRNEYDEDLDLYVADDSETALDNVINLALEDAKHWLLFKLSCCYSTSDINSKIQDGKNFSIIKTYHTRLAILFLKHGGDCDECSACKKEFETLCECGQICSDDGVCLKRRARISVTEPKEKKGFCCGKKIRY